MSTRNKHYLLDRPRSLNLAAVPSSSSGGAELPIHRIMSGKADHFAGFPKSHISRKYTQEDSTAAKMDKVKQVSLAAIFSRRCSRVGKNQAFEDGLTLTKIIFQNRYVALETGLDPPPFMANAILNFHFDFLHPSLMLVLLPQD